MADLDRKEKEDTKGIEVHLGMHWKEHLDHLVRLEKEDQKDWMDHQANRGSVEYLGTKE